MLVAGGGFEPSDLRVMGPTSYQTALSRDVVNNINAIEDRMQAGSRRKKKGEHSSPNKNKNIILTF